MGLRRGLGRASGEVSTSSSSISPASTACFHVLVLAVALDELRHHLAREQLEARADVGVGVAARLVEQDHLVDVGLLELAQLGADRLGRPDEPAGVHLLALRRAAERPGTPPTGSVLPGLARRCVE